MSITITQVRNAKSLQADNARIEVEINHPDYGWIPYGLDPADTDTTINNDEVMALIGTDFAAYVAPTDEELATEAAAEIRSKRNQLLREVDGFVGNPLRWASLSSNQQTAWATYRTALLDVPQQSGFPDTITWPTAP
tara:strand:- start:928 stop:1338 length:411 start_codon:yes stop_codon:yes gene_type:complete